MDADIDAPEAWDITTGGNAVVGVIDTGVDYNHPDLNDNIWRNPGESGGGKESNGIDDDGNGYIDDFRGWDFFNNDNDPMDGQGHGTHVSGTIGAEGNNGIGVVGVNWDVQIMPLQIFSASGNYAGTFNTIKAIEYATLMGADLTNNSWGGGGFSQGLRDAIAAGPLFVAAAGNTNGGNNNDTNPFYPATYNLSNIISVAATNNKDQLASFSHYGKNTVDLGAPGVNIYSTIPVSQGSYGYKSGTSMAAPHVAGVAALIIAGRRAKGKQDLTDLQLKQFILENVDPIPALSGITATGGRLNASLATSKGISWGDVHFVTFDGRNYDLQSVGEFILAETVRDNDNWVVQTRQELWRQNNLVSVNTAFATLVDGHRVVFDLDFGNRLQIDGTNVTLASGQTLSVGNSEIRRDNNVYTLTYAGDDGIVDADDAQLTAWDNSDHINIDIAHFGRLQGLLGKNDGNPDNDFTLRDGTQLSSNPSVEQLHREYADSWRVGQSESLFVNPISPNPNFPARFITLDDLSKQAVKAAKKAVAKVGIPQGALFDAAVFDLVITNDVNFLNGAADLFATGTTNAVVSSNLAQGLTSRGATSPAINHFTGTSQADTLIGTSVNDTFVGSKGKDTITGSGGDDLFVYNKLSHGKDTITDFSEGDRIDISGLLHSINYTGNDALADHYVRFVGQGNETFVQIDIDGLGSGKPRDLITVENVGVDILSNPDNFVF